MYDGLVRYGVNKLSVNVKLIYAAIFYHLVYNYEMKPLISLGHVVEGNGIPYQRARGIIPKAERELLREEFQVYTSIARIWIVTDYRSVIRPVFISDSVYGSLVRSRHCI